MPAAFHYVAFRTTAHATEDPERVHAALRFIAGGDLDVTETVVEGHYKNPIRILEAEVTRRGDVDRFFRTVAADDAVLDRVLSELDHRLADDGAFFLRFGKQDAYLERVQLTRDEDAVRVRGKVAAFPAKRANARKVLDAYLRGLKEGGNDSAKSQ